MKTQLLLFISVVFFFSCEKDKDNTNTAPCNCGEVIGVDFTPAFAGYLTPDPNIDGGFIVTGQHPSYSITQVQMNCSQDTITICDSLEIGDPFCFDYVGDCYVASCEWVEGVVVFDVNGNPSQQDMLVQDISIEGEYLVLGMNQAFLDTVALDCN